MNKEQSSIHEFDFDLICDYFLQVERQGPGSPEVTRKALSFVQGLSERSRIADIGCGTGGQTLVLAEQVPAMITAIDIFPRFIDLLDRNAAMRGRQDRVKGQVGSMEQLPFREQELDLIWSEGAIYFMGFERGLKEWRQFLKPGAYIAVSEASWFTEERPGEIEAFWQEAYPGIDTVSNKLSILQKAGYLPVACFLLPEECWIEHFYAPQVRAQDAFLKKHAGNSTAEAFIASQRHEEELYMKYRDYYGYAFYIGKKI